MPNVLTTDTDDRQRFLDPVLDQGSNREKAVGHAVFDLLLAQLNKLTDLLGRASSSAPHLEVLLKALSTDPQRFLI